MKPKCFGKPNYVGKPKWFGKQNYNRKPISYRKTKYIWIEEYNIKKGDAYVIEPGHDAWVEGDEEVIGYEFESKAIENLENKN